MRSVSTALAAAHSAIVTDPIWLFETVLPSGTERYCTGGNAITYNGNAYTVQDFRVSAPSIGNDGSNNATVIFQGIDETFTALFRAADTEGSTVKIWVTDDLATYAAADDAYQIVESVIDSVNVKPTVVELRLSRQPIYAPNKRVDATNGFTDVTAAGLVQTPFGSVVLT